MNNQQFINEFANGNKKARKHGNLFVDDCILYDYGYHYPLAIDLTGAFGYVFINDAGYSVTTAKHIGMAKMAFRFDNVLNVHTREMKFIIDAYKGNTSAIELFKKEFRARITGEIDQLHIKANKARKHKQFYMDQIEANYRQLEAVNNITI